MEKETEAGEQIHGDGFITHASSKPATGKDLALLALGALGVVYGDIGTSPIYALRLALHPDHQVAPTPGNILGVISMVFWALVLIISVKYLLFILRLDNRGEGGIMSLTSLITPVSVVRRSARWTLIMLGLFGAALLYGDSMLTPAVSVLSAVEGLAVVTELFDPYILPITLVILVGIFSLQRHGTARVGNLFGPVMLVWFATLAVLGIWHIAQEPGVLKAINPIYAEHLFAENGLQAFLVLGSVFLVVTGGEALYADMGHFGRRPIRVTWFALVFPCLLLNYFGQGALMIRSPEFIDNPFFRMAPRWGLIPLVILTTMATIIASQAVISGAYSLTMQAVQLGYLPRVEIAHTSSRAKGQIYIPSINWALMVACIGVVLGFRSSDNLGAAYGLAVTTTMVVTSVLFYVVAREKWKWPLPLAFLVSGVFLLVEGAFWSANLLKIPSGGWFPLVVAGLVFIVMTTWKRGRVILSNRFAASSLPWEFFIADIQESPPYRVPGTAIFMYGNSAGAPPALLHSLQHFGVLHDQIVLLRVETAETPHVSASERATVERAEEGFFRIVLRYGFMEDPNVPEGLGNVHMEGLHLEPERTTFFLGRETLIASRQRVGMSIWRERLFALLAKNARTATSFYHLPTNRVVELGAQIEI